MMETVERDVVLDALREAGLEEDALYADYSGRGMYGAKCFGITGSVEDLVRFVLAMAAADESLEWPVDEWLPRVSSDNMGLSMIWYWPGVQVEEEEEVPA